MTVCGLRRTLFAQSEFDVSGFYHFPLAGLDERFRRGELALLHWTSVFWVGDSTQGQGVSAGVVTRGQGLVTEPLSAGGAARLAEQVAEWVARSTGVASDRVSHRRRSRTG
jgi:hypothetical protein